MDDEPILLVLSFIIEEVSNSKDYKTGERIYMGTSDITEIESTYDMVDVEFRLHDMEEYSRSNYAAFNEVN